MFCSYSVFYTQSSFSFYTQSSIRQSWIHKPSDGLQTDFWESELISVSKMAPHKFVAPSFWVAFIENSKY